MSTKELQAEIKKMIRGMGWSQAEVARFVYLEKNDTENNVELRRYVETFKKKLSRPSTPPEHLEAILRIMQRQKSATSMALKPLYVPGKSLSSPLRLEIQAISRSLDREMNDEALADED